MNVKSIKVSFKLHNSFVLHCFISVLVVCTLVTYIESPLAVAFLFCGSPFNLPFKDLLLFYTSFLC